MGAYVEGEIRRICELTRPQISIVTAVGPQHLERFGSLEATARAKYEIIEALPPDGVGVFNWDNHYVRALYEKGYPANAHRGVVGKRRSRQATAFSGAECHGRRSTGWNLTWWIRCQASSSISARA